MSAIATAEEALALLRDGAVDIDCVVSVYDLPETDGVSLLRALETDHPRLPFVLYPVEGNERVASEAIAAGVADYVVPCGTVPDTALCEGVDRALVRARREAKGTRRAREFETLFGDPLTATWLLDPEGVVRGANDTALDTAEASTAELDGRRLWDLPVWKDEGNADRVRAAFEDAVVGTARTVEVARDTAGGESVVDLSMRAVTDESGAIETVLATTIDVTERAELERDLRRSERLHRVALNNMTETVLVADDGAFTYICLNVRFIFGYTVEEIEAMGTVDELLGADLFDPDALEERDVLTNVEHVAIDEAGTEHTLLINAKRVSIGDGTTLISCRDVTTRKQREAALSTLHDLACDLLYTETREAIADALIDGATRALALEPVACYLFDPETNTLRPGAWTDSLATLHGPIGSIEPSEGNLVPQAFLNGRPVVADGAAGYELDPASELVSATAVPLGDNGVLLAGSTDTEALDEITTEVADLLAATAEVAFDRVRREGELRDRDRELRRRARD